MHALLDALANALGALPAWLATLIISTLPIAELRGGIPVGVTLYGMAPTEAFVWAIIGNAIPVFAILYWLPPISAWLSKHSRGFDRFFSWLFERTRKKFYKKHERWGNLALVAFVAIPAPLTGAWTGSLAAWLFGIPRATALPLIFIGMLIAGVVVTLATMGLISLF